MSDTKFTVTESGEIDDSQFSSIDYVTIGDISTENAKAEVEKWPPDVIRVDFAGELYYYNLADCHNETVEEEGKQMSRSIHEILESAFNEIKEAHDVAVTTASFDICPAGEMASIDYHLTGTSIDCKPCTPKKD